MNRIVQISIAGLLAAGLATGCSNQGPNEQGGAILGGIIGAAVGSTVGKGEGRTLAIAVGTLAGSMIGSSIGRYMDEEDRRRANQALETSPTGKTTVWKNPDTGNTYEVTPTRTIEKPDGQPCREFTMKADIGGKEEEVYGTACRQPDGSWKIVE
ncbi:MAG TPA: glycine zipper 2TM domain-containing protein [Thiotrichales bacterium]|nr:glycine zipper 2TM domain-containing protein [Thiotrichales bacterium]